MGVSMDGIIVRILLVLCLLASGEKAQAASIELSGLVAYGKTELANEGYHSMQRRYTGTISFKFTAVSALEFEYTDSVTNYSYLTDVGQVFSHLTKEEITSKDKIYSFNWVQNLVSSKWLIQPYVVFGGGRMVHSYTQNFPEFGYTGSVTQNVVTGTAGVGMRIFLTRNLAVKAEMKTYVPKFHFKAWKENQMLSVGLSWLM
jgi:hypothetical protein